MPAELDERDRALWATVVSSVTPLKGGHTPSEPPDPTPAASPRPAAPIKMSPRPPPPRPDRPAAPQLDGSWERRLARGFQEPDAVLDLHGLRLDGAWERLDAAVDRVVARGGRVLLVIAGRDRGAEVRTDPTARGRIRAKLPDWLANGRHAARVLAIRPAHARHGGAGAVYVILKRPAR